jgi:hypothetical protein
MLLSGKLQADLMPMQEIRIVPMKTNCQSFAEGPSIRYRDSRLYVRHFANLQVADHLIANRHMYCEHFVMSAFYNIDNLTIVNL